MAEHKERKETAARDENGVRKQYYKRFKEGRDYEPTETEKTVALCDMFLDGFLERKDPEGIEKRGPGQPKKLPRVEDFIDAVERYINYIKDRAEEGVRLIPDIEGFCGFVGISRDSLNDWERSRPGEYSDTIKRFKTNIAAYKKQLAFSGKIPPIVFATDFNNNHGYVQQQTLEIQAPKKLDTLPSKDEIVKKLPFDEKIEEIDAEDLKIVEE